MAMKFLKIFKKFFRALRARQKVPMAVKFLKNF